MCVLIVGIRVHMEWPLVLAANRDEAYDRDADPPTIFGEQPRIAAGRDRRAGGTWLGVNEGGVISALTNRRGVRAGQNVEPATTRGALPLLALERTTARSGAQAVAEEIRRRQYAAFNLVTADTEGTWLVGVPDSLTPTPLSRGWHVLANRRLDDPADPRVQRARNRLRETPLESGAIQQWIAALQSLCMDHGSPPAAEGDALCVHEAEAGTVSAAIVMLNRNGKTIYLHAPGPPCKTPFEPVSLPWQSLPGT